MAGLYFHIPFCKRICAYCDFYKIADLGRIGPVIDAMHDELEREAGFLPHPRLRTIYFGGGTPSLLAPETVGALIEHATRRFDCTSLEECTVEANPDDLTPEYLDRLRRQGVDRLSIGVQSFDDGALKLMNRRHTARQAEEAVRAARQAGFDNLTIDLIFGIPGFGGSSLQRTLQRALDLGVRHISAYHLTIEPQTALGRMAARGAFRAVDETTSEAEYATVHRTLCEAGFEHYEVSNYAQPGFRARHNAAYWSGRPYLGIGPAAHSFDGSRRRRWASASVARYLAGGDLYETELLSDDERYEERIMTGLRTAEGIDPERIGAEFGTERLAHLVRQAERWLATGDLVRRGGRIAIPPERFLVSDAVIEALFL